MQLGFVVVSDRSMAILKKVPRLCCQVLEKKRIFPEVIRVENRNPLSILIEIQEKLRITLMHFDLVALWEKFCPPQKIPQIPMLFL